MGRHFWIRRFVQIFLIALAIITVIQFLKTGDLSFALRHGLIWAAISATVFSAARIWQSRRGQDCAICKDTPDQAKG